MKALHPVFNVVKLRPAHDDPIPGRHTEVPLPPTLVDERGGEHYEIEKVLDSRLFRQKLQFLVKWKGYGYEDNQWIKEDDLDAPELLQDFYRTHPGAPRRLNNGQFANLPMKRRDAVSRRGGDVRGTHVRTLLQTHQVRTLEEFNTEYLALLSSAEPSEPHNDNLNP